MKKRLAAAKRFFHFPYFLSGFPRILLSSKIGSISSLYLRIKRPFSYTYSTFLAIAVVAALDSVFGGITSVLKKNFDLTIFITGFFCNSILSIALTYLGQKLNIDIYLAALVVFVGRMFTNLTIIRRYYVEKWVEKRAEKAKKMQQES